MGRIFWRFAPKNTAPEETLSSGKIKKSTFVGAIVLRGSNDTFRYS